MTNNNVQYMIIGVISLVMLIGVSYTPEAKSDNLHPALYGFDDQQQGLLILVEGNIICPDNTIKPNGKLQYSHGSVFKENGNLVPDHSFSYSLSYENPHIVEPYNLHITDIQIDSENYYISFVGLTGDYNAPFCGLTDRGVTSFTMVGKCDGSEFDLHGANGVILEETSLQVACS